MAFILGSHLKSGGTFSAKEGQNWLEKCQQSLLHFPINYRGSLGKQESTGTFYSPKREYFLSYFA